MTYHDVGRFDARADTYDKPTLQGFFGAVHRATLSFAAAAPPHSVLDVGAGTGELLALVHARFPDAALSGVDPASRMLARAREKPFPAALSVGSVESLPYPAGHFDLVLSTMSFHHWANPARGLAEIHRVLTPGGTAVVAEHFTRGWLRFASRVLPRRNRTETVQEVVAMARNAGLDFAGQATVFRLAGLPFITAVRLRKPQAPE
ncbi:MULTISPECIES: class I SAM-dependent methyltransferase [unclassified Amycolatopsis]|uniref:class I SAM-dependent methyltransferase n=1 Tax=unclassified Amycolatopsis TaxID=2618356 RepID=UPI001C695F5C|nr:class I SAM-dependent methyltransferase [Amycolatopsis sp. DSM 110486]QYN17809.1 class I SAM-dependent methyltransferase [Amycolatopsis sp. DSM 110486]